LEQVVRVQETLLTRVLVQVAAAIMEVVKEVVTLVAQAVEEVLDTTIHPMYLAVQQLREVQTLQAIRAIQPEEIRGLAGHLQ
jgi:hypothetical protein